ncbi:hypothetical protein DSO57_1006028 [Entomophthora muscae]|uniref:Uncharacterized protein n=1 Tax=Entomophthora muscae TaxID=34485 RepID=A0ACC2T7H3_9FUNG|nr:hypothetical protein DSO57_1006028 [Entomophthora muscae]
MELPTMPPPLLPCGFPHILQHPDIINHFFYQSRADSEPTNQRRAKKEKAAKELTSFSYKKKETSKQASRSPSPPPPDDFSPLFSSDYQEELEDYTKKFKATSHVAWDPLAIHSICNVNEEFKVPKQPWNQNQQTKSKNFV